MTEPDSPQTPSNGSNECPEEVLEALKSGDRETLTRSLLSAPALARARTPEGVSLLLFALYNGQLELAVLLRQHRDELDLYESAAMGDLPELQRVIRLTPVASDGRTTDGFSALHLAAFFGQDRAVRLLLAAGADVEASGGPDGLLRPLHSAAASRQASTVRILLGAGADPDARQSGGYTALQAAAQHANRAMAVALLAHGADSTLATDDGRDALALAREANATELEELLQP